MTTRRSIATVGTLGVLGLVACLGASGCKLIVPPKIMVVMLENKNYSEVVGPTSTEPYVNQLAQQYGLVTQAYSSARGSLSNYLEITSGSNQGVTDDLPPSAHSFPAAQTLADQLVAGGFSVGAYAENLPADPTNDSGQYAVRHVPWEYFPNAPIKVKDSSALVPDLNGSSAPDFIWYTPNITDQGDVGGAVGADNTFLSTFIPQVQATAWYKSGGQVILMWDESDNDTTDINGGQNGGGHIPAIVVSQALGANPRQSTVRVATAGILHSLEHIYLLPYLGDAGVAANGNIDSLLYW